MLRDYQERAIKLLYGWLATHQGNPCIVAPTGCHARGQGILMANGSVHAVEDINVGDRVMGGDGTPRMVIDLHRGNSMMYKIVPIKGKPFVVNEGHVLSLISTNEGKEYNCSTTGKEIINISVKDYLAKSNNWKHLHKLYRGKVEVFEGDSDAHLLIPPYIVGILLGDGSLDKGAALTNPDFEIYFDWHCYLANIGCYASILKKSTTECCTYSAVSINKKDPDKRTPRGTSEINKRLRAVGIFGMKAQSKRVPDNYKTCSYKNRLELLAGLLDTDGSLSGPNGYDYISKSEQLSKDVAFISQSLGLRAICHPCIKTCSNTGKSGMYYRVSISGDTSIIPCRLPKKQAQPLKQKKRPNVTGFTVEPVGVGEFFGFETDGDHLYMLDDFTVTHNSGKSHIIAGLCKDVMTRWPASRILILSHVKELLQQDAEKIIMAWPEAPMGIYSAGMHSRDIGLPITVAGIQSVSNKAELLGFIDICIVDEAHLISHKAEGGYRQLIESLQQKNPNMRVVGLTATPYRLGHGLISEHGALFDALIEPVKVEELVARGFLAPLRSKFPQTTLSVDGVGKRGGEFIESELQARVNTDDDNEKIVSEVLSRSAGRKAWLFFCAGVAHAEAMRDTLRRHEIRAEVVTGATPLAERDRIITDFKAGRIRALTNANVLTTGFDYPAIDLIALCRPTMSPGLYMQTVGRGMRIAPDKTDCLVLDFAGNVKRHGPITDVQPPKHKGPGTGDAPVKVCPECDELMHTSVKVCPSCGYEFPPAEKPPVRLYDDDIMGNEPQEMKVKAWWWSVRTSRAKGIQMLCVEYEDEIMTGASIKEFVTIMHDGSAKYRAEIIMQEMIKYSGANLPNFEETTDYLETVAEAMNNARCPAKIEYKKDGQYYRVLRRIWSTPAAVGA